MDKFHIFTLCRKLKKKKEKKRYFILPQNSQQLEWILCRETIHHNNTVK